MVIKLLLPLLAVLGLCSADSIFNILSAAHANYPNTEDGASAVAFSGNFPFFGTNVTTFYMGINGLISFNKAVEDYDTTPWPNVLPNTDAVLAYWADINGFSLAKRYTRGALPSELQSISSRVVSTRPGITAINARSAMLFEWRDVSPCGCFFPRNSIQVALLTDGCASYAVMAYPSILWGDSEGARVGYVRTGVVSEVTASSSRLLTGLQSGYQVLYFGGENPCTGASPGSLLQDSTNSSIYYKCGECSPETIACPPGMTYDDQCKKCVINRFPNCDLRVDGKWTTWLSVGTCSSTCGNGLQQQTRSCTDPPPSNGGATCAGSPTQNIPCNLLNCPIDGVWGVWTVLGTCPVTCGSGKQTERRVCTPPQFGGADCVGNDGTGQQTRTTLDCNTNPCPVAGVWSSWIPVGTCTVTCGGGLQSERRTCTPPQFGGADCVGNDGTNIQTKNILACNTQACPVNGVWGAWTPLGACPVTCGGGKQTERRICTPPSFGGANCVGNDGTNIQTRTILDCSVNPCPIPGVWSVWIPVGTCTVTCGGGLQSERRTCTPPQFGGADCAGNDGTNIQTRTTLTCNTLGCAVNGAWTSWTNLGTCGSTCGNGLQPQTRSCTDPPPSNGGATCPGSATQNIACKIRECPINGVWGVWSPIGLCSASCGGGKQTERRICTPPSFGGADCVGNDGTNIQTRNILDCGINSCPVAGVWSAWTPIGTCTVSCGGGLQSERRTCTPPTFGGADCVGNDGTNIQTKTILACNTQRCPDICTNVNALDLQVVYDVANLTWYCDCERTSDNLASYVRECFHCPPNTAYNVAVEACTIVIQYQCTADPFCVGKTPGDYSIKHGAADASCYNNYYTCDAQLQLVQKNCGTSVNGNYFNADTRTCVSGLPAATCANYYCIGRTNGNYERVDNICKSYRRCTNFVETVQTCPVSTPYYNNVLKVCVSGTVPPTGQSCIHPNCNGKADGFYVVDNRCDAFYQCQSQQQLQFVACTANQYYDASIRQCTTNYPGGACQNKFCIQRSNLVNGIFNTAGTSCTNSYVQCSGNSSPVPNVLTQQVCPGNQYFTVTNLATFAGSCAASPPLISCPNYQCIGRANGFTVAFTGAHDCTRYYSCQNQVATIVSCPVGQYYDGTSSGCSSTLNEAICQHPECLSNGRQGGPGSYPIDINDQCKVTYYLCSATLYRTTQSCQTSTTGQYFGLGVNNVWQCLSGNAPSTCGINYVCIGKTPTTGTFPLYDNPNEQYCTGYISCSVNGIASFLTCPLSSNGLKQYLDISSFQCSVTFPIDQACWRDGGYGPFGTYSYVVGSSCSQTCGSGGYQLQLATRLCNNPTRLGSGQDCDPNAAVGFRNHTCQNDPLPACDTFCANRVAGSYSKTLELTPPVNLACFKDYYICSGAPQFARTNANCPASDYVFNPVTSSCQRGDPVANCPILYCSRKTDGLHALSTQVHDCRNYVNCVNEFHIILTCSAINGVPTYFNPNNNQCETTPQSNCNPVKGFWSSWASDGLGCSIRSNGACQSRQIRSCNNPPPVNDATSCPGSSEQFFACTSCGDAFCVGKLTGSYSKTLTLTPPVNLACFSGYYICTQPGNVLTTGQCTDADYFFNPSVSACRRGQDSTCPQTFCGGKTDGFHAFSINTHDCRQYLSCANEIATVLTCTNDPVTGKQRYFNSGTCSVTPPLNFAGQALCDPVFGYWSSWASGACSLVNSACQRTKTRTCSNPEPINDPNSCPGLSSTPEACASSSCQTSCSTNPCHSTTQCSSTGVGTGYSCSCLSGYQFSSGVLGTNTLICSDIDECAVNPNSCTSDRRCVNSPAGTFTCLTAACLASPCHSTTQCTSTNVGTGYTCTCPNGFELSSGVLGTNTLICRDIDECAVNPNSCTSDRRCVNSPAGTFTCLTAACITNPCDSTTQCTSTNVGLGYTCTCPVGTQISSGTDGTNTLRCVAIAAETCVGKQNGYRIADSSNPRNYIVCNGSGGNRETLTCPSGQVSVGFDIVASSEILAGNGIYYSPVFRTCVNTTTGNAPATVPKLANGQYDITKSCTDIADEQRVPAGTSATKLPYIYDTTCKIWITCNNQVLENSQQNPPEAGKCTSQFYNSDLRTCTPVPAEGSCN